MNEPREYFVMTREVFRILPNYGCLNVANFKTKKLIQLKMHSTKILRNQQ